jgi:hypothetical protein
VIVEFEMAQNPDTVTVTVTGRYSEPSLEVEKTFNGSKWVKNVIKDTGNALRSQLNSTHETAFIRKEDLCFVGTTPTTSGLSLCYT